MSIHHFMFASSFYFVILAFGGNISFILAAGIFITVSLVSLLSLIPGQLGIYEVLSISFLTLTVGLVNGTLVTSVVRLIQYWSIIFIGGFFAIQLGLETIKFDHTVIE
mgnify:FL=1